MPRKKVKAKPEPAILVSPPELWRSTFEREDIDYSEVADDTSVRPNINFSLGFNRFTRTQIGVEFQVELSASPLFSLSIVYRATFDFQMEDSTDAEIDAQMRNISRIGAQTLYPFVRETAVSQLQKAGIAPVVPPLINFQDIINPDEIEIPPPPESTGDESNS